MAEIPVERTKTNPWWLWLIGLLALLALLVGGWYAAGALEGDDVAVAVYETTREPDVATVVAIPRSDAPLTSVRPLLDTPLAYVGRSIAIPNLRVTDVVGDAAFYVTPAPTAVDQNGVGRHFFVWLEEVATPNEPRIEGRYDVNAGQTITVYGTVERLENRDPAHWGITEAEAERMKDDIIYLRASKLDITDAKLDFVEID